MKTENNNIKYEKININELIENEKKNDPEFEKEYTINMIKREIMKDIKESRESKKLTQKELAEKLGWKQQQLSRIENDNTDITLSNLIKIFTALDIKEIHFNQKKGA